MFSIFFIENDAFITENLQKIVSESYMHQEVELEFNLMPKWVGKIHHYSSLALCNMMHGFFITHINFYFKTVSFNQKKSISMMQFLNTKWQFNNLSAQIMVIIQLISNFQSSAKLIYIMVTISSNKDNCHHSMEI